MRITYYGTGAGEAWPGVFCQCRVCREARRLGGKNIRTRSQALVNDDLLLDLPPDNQLHSLYFGLDLSRVKSLLFTHSHSDHCYLPDLEFLRRPFSHTHDDILEIYGNEAIEELLRREPGGLGSQEARYRYHTVPCHVPFGPDMRETSGASFTGFPGMERTSSMPTTPAASGRIAWRLWRHSPGSWIW